MYVTKVFIRSARTKIDLIVMVAMRKTNKRIHIAMCIRIYGSIIGLYSCYTDT